jgi:hypothetical protein
MLMYLTLAFVIFCIADVVAFYYAKTPLPSPAKYIFLPFGGFLALYKYGVNK